MFVCIESYDRFDAPKARIYEVDDRLIERALALNALKDSSHDESEVYGQIDDFLEDELPKLKLPDDIIDLLTELTYSDIDPTDDGMISIVAEEFTAGIGQTKKDAKAAFATAQMDG